MGVEDLVYARSGAASASSSSRGVQHPSIAVKEAGDVDASKTVDRCGRGRSGVPHSNHRIMATTKLADYIAVILQLKTYQSPGSIRDVLQLPMFARGMGHYSRLHDSSLSDNLKLHRMRINTYRNV